MFADILLLIARLRHRPRRHDGRGGQMRPGTMVEVRLGAANSWL
jgi:hypothetical protein